MRPKGPYDLAAQSRYFGEWAGAEESGRARLVMVFPVESWKESAAVAIAQRADGEIHAAAHGVVDTERAVQQALAVLSLDVDGSGYPVIGERDPVIGRLQVEHAFLRPVLFHSPFEAACSFIIGHRIRIVQGRAIRRRMAEQFGAAIDVDGLTVHAFPSPQRLLRVDACPGLSPMKIERLHGAARAALDGRLDRAALRSMPFAGAVATVKTISGLGGFFATGVVLRGAGLVDEAADDEITLAGIARLYGIDANDMEAVASITGGWRPYRTWCSVLVHAAQRRAQAQGAS